MLEPSVMVFKNGLENTGFVFKGVKTSRWFENVSKHVFLKTNPNGSKNVLKHDGDVFLFMFLTIANAFDDVFKHHGDLSLKCSKPLQMFKRNVENMTVILCFLLLIYLFVNETTERHLNNCMCFILLINNYQLFEKSVQIAQWLP